MASTYDSEARSKALTCEKGCTCRRHTEPKKRSLSAEEANARLKAKNLVALEPWHGSTQKPWKIKCMRCGHEGAPRLASLSTQSGCRPCGYIRREKALAVEHRNKFMPLLTDNGFTPLEEYKGADTFIKCRHTCGETVMIRPMSFTQSVKTGSTIMRCQCQMGTGALAKGKAEQAIQEMRDAGHEPLEPFASVNSPWRTIHLECGEERRSTLGSIRAGGSGCYPCSRKTWKHPDQLTHDEATDYIRSRGFEPIDEYPGSQKKWKMRHSCGAVVTPSLTNLKGGSGCKGCHSSFNYTEEAILYLLKNTSRNALKVGIAGAESSNRRMNDNIRNGFAIVKTWAIATGQEAEDIEQEVIRHWRQDLNAPPNVKKEHMRSCHTETASMSKVGMMNTINYIESLV